jgi:MFS family permease
MVYIGACLGLALTPDSAYWLLMLLRCMQAAGGSSVIAIGAGCVSDIATSEERASYLGIFGAGAMFGPAS